MAEKQSKAETLRQILEEDFTLSVIGSNHARKNPFLYGELGVAGADAAYTKAMNSERAQKSREDIYKRKKIQGERLGVYGEPTHPTNYDLALNVASAVHESMAMLPLGLLEEIVSGVADGLEVKVPDKLKMVTYDNLMEKVGKDGDLTALDDHEKKAIRLFDLFKQAYERGAALRATESNYFADINEEAKGIAESYGKGN